MKRLFFTYMFWVIVVSQSYAISIEDIGFKNWLPSGSILSSGWNTPISLVVIIQSFILKILLPIVVVWAALYMAYELFTAEGDESKMKRAWKSIAYTAIALIAIALSYALVSIISRISL